MAEVAPIEINIPEPSQETNVALYELSVAATKFKECVEKDGIKDNIAEVRYNFKYGTVGFQ